MPPGMRKILILILVFSGTFAFAKKEETICENSAAGLNLVSPDGGKSILRNHWGFEIVSNRGEDTGKILRTVKASLSSNRWEYLWSDDSRFLKATRLSSQGEIEALFVVDFQRNFIVYPYALLTTGHETLERLTKASLMGDRYLLARYGANGTYEILRLDTGRVVRSTLQTKWRLRDKDPETGRRVTVSPGDLPESL